MKRITVQRPLTGAGGQELKRTEEAQAWIDTCAPGLAALNSPHGGWVVVHVATGLNICVAKNRDEALAIMRELGLIEVDWTEVHPRLARGVQGAWQRGVQAAAWKRAEQAAQRAAKKEAS